MAFQFMSYNFKLNVQEENNFETKAAGLSFLRDHAIERREG